jgi:lysophospholipase L1-like esterase
MTKNRRLNLRLSALGLGLLIGLMVAEAAARVLKLSPSIGSQYAAYVPDPYLPFKPRPLSHTRGRSETGEFDHDNRHNSFGLRDVEHAVAGEPGVLRILGLGDSFTYGGGVAFEDGYLAQLERRLNEGAARGAKVEIIKAGIPRFYPEPERIFLERYGVAYRPDVILVGFVPNDVIDTYYGFEAVRLDRAGYLKTREAAELGDFGSAVYDGCHACRLVLRRYVAWQTARKYRPQMAEVYRANGFHEADWRKVEAEYDRMAEIAAGIKAKLVIVHIPHIGPWAAEHNYPAERLAAWAAKRGAGFVDTLPAFKSHSDPQSLYYPRDKHCTPAGYGVIARVIDEYLTGRKLVPQDTPDVRAGVTAAK